jgi:hypothetical protein
MIFKLVMSCRSGHVLDCFRLFGTFPDTTAFCLSVETCGQNQVKSDIQVQIFVFKEVNFDDF